jgi:hypothetical protein
MEGYRWRDNYRVILQPGMSFTMNEILAHITQHDVPGFWLAAFAGFLAGVATTYALLARKWK